MRNDPTLFRQRFQRWKNGEQVYDAGLPTYADGLQPTDEDEEPIYTGKPFVYEEYDGQYHPDPMSPQITPNDTLVPVNEVPIVAEQHDAWIEQQKQLARLKQLQQPQLSTYAQYQIAKSDADRIAHDKYVNSTTEKLPREVASRESYERFLDEVNFAMNGLRTAASRAKNLTPVEQRELNLARNELKQEEYEWA